MSSLGLLENGQIAKIVKRHTNTLQEYLASHLSDRVKVIGHSYKSHLVGAIPRSVDTEQEGGHDALLEKTQVDHGLSKPRFSSAFWAAFRKPVDETKRRYVSRQGPVQFLDVSPSDKPPGYIEIDRKYIVGSDVDSDRVLRVAQDWLEDHEIDSKDYIEKPAPRSRRPHDLLDQLFDVLDINDLKRITMPLDIVFKLRHSSSQ